MHTTQRAQPQPQPQPQPPFITVAPGIRQRGKRFYVVSPRPAPRGSFPSLEEALAFREVMKVRPRGRPSKLAQE